MSYIAISTHDVERISSLSEKEKFSLWFDDTNGMYYTNIAPEQAHWIFDVEQKESPEFILEMTRVVINQL